MLRTPSRRSRVATAALAAALSAALAGTLLAAPSGSAAHGRSRDVVKPSPPSPPPASSPRHLPLPAGFQPEGIAIGERPVAWLGSLADGDIYRLGLDTGRGRVVVEGDGRPAVGLEVDDRGRLFVAGGDSGSARVVDTDSGRQVADLQLTTEPGFINDVVLARRSAWFTDSANAEIHRVLLDRRGVPSGRFITLSLGGEWVQPAGFGANGITTTPDRRALLVVNSTEGALYRVRMATGEARRVRLGGATVVDGDGLLRRGRTLHVVQNRSNQVAEIRLNRRGTAGAVRRTITSPDFDVPTTVAAHETWLYLPNARFGTATTPDTDYWVTRVRR